MLKNTLPLWWTVDTGWCLWGEKYKKSKERRGIIDRKRKWINKGKNLS
jgi:hypothetical protein